jgi:hypothetical protein
MSSTTNTPTLFLLPLVATLACINTGIAYAGPADYVASPLVSEGEKEIDFKMGTAVDSEGNRKTVTSVGFGFAPKPWLFTELYAKGVNEAGKTSFDAFELEAKVQLTERGKYPIEIGVLLEIERPKNRDEGYEVTYGLLLQKDFDQYQANFNTILQRSYQSIGEQPTHLNYQYQLKYRYKPAFELGLQGFGGVGQWDKWSKGNEAQHNIGPAVFGKLHLGGKNMIAYNVAWLRATTTSTPNNTLRMQMEYEF